MFCRVGSLILSACLNYGAVDDDCDYDFDDTVSEDSAPSRPATPYPSTPFPSPAPTDDEADEDEQEFDELSYYTITVSDEIMGCVTYNPEPVQRRPR